jgi:hypothetical protein
LIHSWNRNQIIQMFGEKIMKPDRTDVWRSYSCTSIYDLPKDLIFYLWFAYESSFVENDGELPSFSKCFIGRFQYHR